MFDDLENSSDNIEKDSAGGERTRDSARRFNSQIAGKESSGKILNEISLPKAESKFLSEKKQQFDRRINQLREKGKKRGFRYSVIGISASILICAAVLFGGYYLLTEVFNITQKMDNKGSAVLYPLEDPDGRCGDACCLSSLLRIRSGRYLEIAADENCPRGYKKNILNCDTSLVWCEPIIKNADGGGTKAIDFADDSAGSGRASGTADIISKNMESASTTPDKASTTPEIGKSADSDNDGLSDEEEKKYGTDPNNPDTDGDGFLDGLEVKNGYNPNGKGLIDK